MRIAASRTFSLLALLLLIPAASFAQVAIGVGIHVGPPALPVYAQPPCPVAGYIWTPGYWAYGHLGYYWVPGVWAAPPRVGLLWTPGYWGFAGGVYAWHAGFWGPRVGFYGGINYGFGYGGLGFTGGVWAGSVFRYNTAVVNVNTAVVHDTFVDRNVVNNIAVVNHTSFNGEGGVMAHATPGEQAAMNERHMQPTAGQMSHEQAGANDRNQLAAVNHGTPGTAAMDSVNGRRFNQQGRIAQGIGSGQLTPAETHNLENRESRLNGEIHNDRAASDGTLTPQERQQVNQQQNNLSRSIYDDKHNGATDQYGKNEVGDRRSNQQQRIASGVGDGQLSPKETANLEGREQNVNHEVAADRRANGGKLTPQERQQVNRQQNRASRQIYRDKHNGKKAPR